ncbi:MAG: hypothetical protein WCA22_23000 [Candidatus Binatus sp.]
MKQETRDRELNDRSAKMLMQIGMKFGKRFVSETLIARIRQE